MEALVGRTLRSMTSQCCWEGVFRDLSAVKRTDSAARTTVAAKSQLPPFVVWLLKPSGLMTDGDRQLLLPPMNVWYTEGMAGAFERSGMLEFTVWDENDDIMWYVLRTMKTARSHADTQDRHISKCIAQCGFQQL